MEPQIGLLSAILLSCLFHTDANLEVFQPRREASTVFQRPKRANYMLLEEILQGNLERECYEEICNYEEAREYFEDTPKTNTFWTVYYDGDQCRPNPCLHGAQCTDKIGGYSCNCTELFKGVNCEKDVSECQSDGPSSCEHFCRPSFSSYQCFCAEGYKIHSDGRSCLPTVLHPCGRAPIGNQNNTDPIRPGGHHCPNGHCPWQVMLINATGQPFCSGVLLGQRSVLTSAGCVSDTKGIRVVVGEPRRGREGEGRGLSVLRVFMHESYVEGQLGQDLAFLQLRDHVHFSPAVFKVCLPEKDFSENVLMRSGREGLLGARGRAEAGDLPVYLTHIPQESCKETLQLAFPLTNKMFCGKARFVDAFAKGNDEELGRCLYLAATPLVTVERNTTFLTGLLISPQSQTCWRGHAFTKISRYLPWLQKYLALSEK